eukprot:CAMPEP_0197857820 /NCGR_PEP_ID=MMETSP1438-20131217/31225_1 /TAXON_ID=1461541 /ORGANISM="Pterosperma sp., Strain CCMP1384" /LENGTH=529 /DNA_ID=CAMNT_0043473795 /DNA_START=613 /DNA_END=2199 /DNA_ORIENTATION=+
MRSSQPRGRRISKECPASFHKLIWAHSAHSGNSRSDDFQDRKPHIAHRRSTRSKESGTENLKLARNLWQDQKYQTPKRQCKVATLADPSGFGAEEDSAHVPKFSKFESFTDSWIHPESRRGFHDEDEQSINGWHRRESHRGFHEDKEQSINGWDCLETRRFHEENNKSINDWHRLEECSNVNTQKQPWTSGDSSIVNHVTNPEVWIGESRITKHQPKVWTSSKNAALSNLEQHWGSVQSRTLTQVDQAWGETSSWEKERSWREDWSENWSENWSWITVRLTELGTIPFLLLLLPQVIKNTVNLMAGNPEALSIIAWKAYTNGLLGNLLLMSYFCEKGERAASVVQAIGVASQAVLLTQIFIAGHMPGPYYWTMAAIVTCGVAFTYLRNLGKVSKGVWHKWQMLLAMAGTSTLSHLLWTAAGCVETSPAIVIPTVTIGSVLIMDEMQWLPSPAHAFCGTFYAWTATLLFMAMPVAQLVNNFTNPLSLRGLSTFSVLLGFMGNCLTIPRALRTRDIIWFTGCTWGAVVMGW